MLALPHRQLALVTKAAASLSPAARDDFLSRVSRLSALRPVPDGELASIISSYVESALSLSEGDY